MLEIPVHGGPYFATKVIQKSVLKRMKIFTGKKFIRALNYIKISRVRSGKAELFNDFHL